MAYSAGISSPPRYFQPPSLSPARPPYNSSCCARLNGSWIRQSLLLRVNCSSERNGQDREASGDSKPDAPSVSAALPESSSTGADISAYGWCAGLGGLGFVETSYLTYLKFTNSDAFCPIGGGGSCSDVLNSSYSVVFGVPLPLVGMVAYGVVAVLGLQLTQKSLPFGIGETNGRLILVGATTAMAVASAYFLYILSSKFPGEPCLYCLASALFSFTLFFITLKDLAPEEMQKNVVLQLCIAALVVSALGTSYNSSLPVSTSFGETELPFFTTEITTHSSPLALALAKHLHSIGAKMYGAFWCSHCLEQKEMFGQEAAKILDYVECFPDGYRKGIKIAKACADIGIEGFPTWVIDGQVLSGDQELLELARVSGFNLEDVNPSN